MRIFVIFGNSFSAFNNFKSAIKFIKENLVKRRISLIVSSENNKLFFKYYKIYDSEAIFALESLGQVFKNLYY